jgi:cytochrome c oxidase assembly protein subunit 11
MARLTPGKNGAVAILLFGVVSGMVGLSFAAVPLYRLFCQVTGYGGTTQVAEALPDQVGERIFTVRFNADLNQDMPWRFQPKQREVTLRVGEPGLAFYQAENLATAPVTGTATFNVTPLKVGPYFSKVDCFCFEEQPGRNGGHGGLLFRRSGDPGRPADGRRQDYHPVLHFLSRARRDGRAGGKPGPGRARIDQTQPS